METCRTRGCTRQTHDGTPGHCCRTCGKSKGCSHGSVCAQRQSHTSLASGLPLHWETDGKSPELVRVTNDEEFQAVTASLVDFLGDGTEIISVERHEHAKLWGQYILERDAVREHANERELWHGTDALDDVLAEGFNTAYASLENNVYGVGVYRLYLLDHVFILWDFRYLFRP